MMGKGYSWVVTDGVTGAHHLLEQENRLYPDYLDGLIGTMPKSTVGAAFRKFAKLYSQNFTRERLLTTGFLEWNPLSLTVIFDISWLCKLWTQSTSSLLAINFHPGIPYKCYSVCVLC